MDRTDCLPAIEKARVAREADRQAQQAQRERVAVEMQYVTQDAHWDLFLEHLQAIVTAHTAAAKGLEAQILGTAPLSEPERDSLRERYQRLQGEIAGMTTAMTLPRQLIQAATKAEKPA
jgi:hypothetical protein